MADCTATFEAGSAGNTIATTDPGSLTPWSQVSIAAGTTATYDATNTYRGALAAKLTTGVSAAVFLAWTTPFGVMTDHYGRFYSFVAVPVTVNALRLMRTRNGANTGGSIEISTAGKLRLLDSAGTVQATSVVSVATGQYVRVEYHFIQSATVGQIEAVLYNNPASLTPTETITTAANLNTLANADAVQFGIVLAKANGEVWLDNIEAGAMSYPGPFGQPDLLVPLGLVGGSRV